MADIKDLIVVRSTVKNDSLWTLLERRAESS